MADIAARAASIAAKIRSAENARGTTKPTSPDEPQGSGFPARAWWTIHRPGAEPMAVFVHPPLTQPQVREHFYPTASGVIPLGI